MVKVMGASADRVSLKDLSEYIYYRQKRIFSDEDFKKSADLRRAIKNGKVIVLDEKKDIQVRTQSSSEIIPQKITILKEMNVSDKKENKAIESSIPPQQHTTIIQAPQSYDSSDKLDLLLSKIENQESKIKVKESPELPQSVLDVILGKIQELEKKISGAQIGTSDQEVLQSLKNLEKKISNNTIDESIVNKLQAIVSSSGEVRTKDLAEIQMETYVPNIQVEDANSHINLNVRTVEKTDDVNSALAALKRLKNKQ